MKSRSGQPLAHVRLAVVAVAARGDLRRRAPRTRRPRATSSSSACAAAMRSAKPLAQLRRRRPGARAGAAASRRRAARTAARARRRAPPPRTRAAATTTGTAPPASARSTQLRRGRGAVRGGHRDRGAGQVLGLRAVGGPGEAHAVAQPRAAARPPAREPGRAARSWPASRGRPAAGAARAGTAAARRAPPRPRTRSRAARRRRRRGRCSQVGARRDHLVVAREEALDQVARGGEARGAAVEAAEQQLDQLARHLGREDALGGGVEGADVQRARVAQRGRRRARRERLVHVHEVELGAVEQVLDRARHVERQRHRAAARGTGRLWPTRQHLRAARLGEQRVGVVGAAP